MITIKRTFCPGRGMIRPEELTGYVFSPEAAAHMFIITKMEKVDGQEAAVPFDAGTDISCRFIKANGVTELVDGDLTDDGAASITLPAECYQVPGRFILSIYAETSEETICIYSATATALAGDTEEINVSSNTKRTIDAQIDALNDAVENAQEVIDSIPQDYTALSDSVSDLKSAIYNYNAINILPPRADSSGKVGDNVDYTCTDGWYWTFNGTATSNVNRNLLAESSAVPEWFKPGNTLRIRLNKTGQADAVRLVIYAYDGTNPTTSDRYMQTYNDIDYVVPDTLLSKPGLMIRLYIASGSTVNCTVYPQIISGMPNGEMVDQIRTDSIKFVSNPSTVYAGKTLAEVDDNVRMIVSKSDFSDIPYAGQCIIFQTSTSYNVQILFRNTTGAIFTRIVNRSNHTVYRDWAQHALLSDVDGKYDSVTRFDGKKIYCDGDSMMLGVVTSSPRVLADLPVYANIQERIPGATVYNASHGGDTIISREDTDLSICDSILADDTVGTYDYFVINGGTNDFTFDATIGTIDSTDETEFYGALNAIMQYILTENPEARVMLITPLFRNYSHTLRGNAYNLQNNAGSTLGDYCDAMINIGKKYCMPVFDSRCLGGVNEYNYETMLEKRDPSDPSPSQGIYAYLHPTNDCYTQYGNAIASYFIANN